MTKLRVCFEPKEGTCVNCHDEFNEKINEVFGNMKKESGGYIAVSHNMKQTNIMEPLWQFFFYDVDKTTLEDAAWNANLGYNLIIFDK